MINQTDIPYKSGPSIPYREHGSDLEYYNGFPYVAGLF